MPKEGRTVNPAQAQRKADKQKEIAKSRKLQQGQRNEKLVKRNPERLQRQIDELKEVEGRGGLKPKDKETLAGLERDLRGVKKAREVLGPDAVPKFSERRHEGGGRGGRGGDDGRRDVRSEQRERRQQQQNPNLQHLGKRRRDEEEAQSSDVDDPEVRDIPMPRDTPPFFPRAPRERFVDPQVGQDGQRVPHALPSKPAPAVQAQTVYSSAPQLRDLKKEAVRFMPSVVAQHQKRIKGQGGRLLEPEELDKLEQSGYVAAQKAADAAGLEAQLEQRSSKVRAEASMEEGIDLDEEARRFEAEINSIYPAEAEELPDGRRAVQMEDVDDDGT
ncbi:hypothetical protein LTR36_000292 [Oleoguttula mirabilis]|uniref:Wbp11/ELF5/Saf1 N-terminal domain-containing protein n=1 Tax=Oleoguttula mirabilis TaxID=1507867 RepID=A0AAV9JY48_9PEZI|nr:hypothetical protein LTR36_000292 [Oleoguttula mirabilis]